MGRGWAAWEIGVRNGMFMHLFYRKDMTSYFIPLLKGQELAGYMIHPPSQELFTIVSCVEKNANGLVDHRETGRCFSLRKTLHGT